MTIKELSQLYWLNKEIEQHEERLEVLRSKATDTTQTITGMPHTPGVSDKVGNYATEIADLLNRIEEAKHRRIVERDVLLQYIEAIPDSVTRQIFTLRFHDGMSWDQVADTVGGGNTYGSVKQRVFRFIKSSPNVTA